MGFPFVFLALFLTGTFTNMALAGACVLVLAYLSFRAFAGPRPLASISPRGLVVGVRGNGELIPWSALPDGEKTIGLLFEHYLKPSWRGGVFDYSGERYLFFKELREAHQRYELSEVPGAGSDLNRDETSAPWEHPIFGRPRELRYFDDEEQRRSAMRQALFSGRFVVTAGVAFLAYAASLAALLVSSIGSENRPGWPYMLAVFGVLGPGLFLSLFLLNRSIRASLRQQLSERNITICTGCGARLREGAQDTCTSCRVAKKSGLS